MTRIGFLLLGCALFCGFRIAEGVCPNEWTPYGESCYILVDDKESWYNAEEVCKLFGAHLVGIQDQNEDNFVKRMARNKNMGSVWTGGNDIFSNRKWSWIYKMTPFTFTDWAPGEPVASVTSRCIALWAQRDYRWDDERCHGQLPFICERP